MRDLCNCYFSFWTIFCTFITLTARIIKILIKKKCPEVSSFYASVPKVIIICYTVPEIYGARRIEVLFFILGYFLTFHPPSSSKKKFRKMRKKTTAATTTTTCRYHHFTQMHQKSWSYAILFLRYMVCDRCNYFSFGLFFVFYRPNSPKNRKLKKKQQTNKQTKTMYQKLWLDNVQFLRYGAQRKDGRKKWRIEVGAPPKKNQYFE